MKTFKEVMNKHATRKFEFYDYETITTNEFVKELRTNLNMTQSYFARTLGVSKKTVEKWEQGRNKVTGATSLLLYILSKEPEIILKYAFFDTNYKIPEFYDEKSTSDKKFKKVRKMI